jgi:hypothetical protein
VANPIPEARGRLNVLRRYRPDDHPDIAAAKVALREAVLRDRIIRENDADPPLSPEARASLAALLMREASG